MSPIDTYLSKIDAAQKAELGRVRKIIKQIVPDAEETISWGMPTFKYNKKNLIHFAAFKNHMSLFPGAPVKFKEKLKDYKLSKGTIQFTLEKPLPESLIKEIVHDRLEEVSQS
jgi:uncharacterized protein YdhG (YjbR/CyaY superfamily)